MKQAKRTLALFMAMIMILSLMSIATSAQPSGMNLSHYSHSTNYQILPSLLELEPTTATPAAMDIAPMSGTPVAPVFFDDFTNDTLFWNISMGDMRRYNNTFVTSNPLGTNNPLGWSRAETRGRLWDNFTAEIDFTKTTPIWTGEGRVTFYIRYVAADNNLAIFIREDHVAVMHNGEDWEFVGDNYTFTRGVMHRLKIEAQDEEIWLSVWDDGAGAFTPLHAAPIIHMPPKGQSIQAGRVVLASWQEHFAIDSVRITDNNPQDFFFADSMVRAVFASPQAILPINNTGQEIVSKSFRSSNPAIISVDNAGVITALVDSAMNMDTVVVSAAAVLVNGDIRTAQYDVVVYSPLRSFSLFHENYNLPSTITLRVGDTMNLNVFTQPIHVADVEFIWTNNAPNVVEIVGFNQIQRGIRALSPGTATVRVTHPTAAGHNNEITIIVEPTITTPIDHIFSIAVPEAIPEHFWGVNLGTPLMFMNSWHHVDNVVYNNVLERENRFLTKMQPQIVRFILEHYDSETDQLFGTISGTHTQHISTNVLVPLSDLLRQANDLGIPAFFATSTRNDADHKVELISAARRIVTARPLFVSIMNEPHDPTNDVLHMIGRTPPATVQDYMYIVREVYTRVNALYDDVVIAVCTNAQAFIWTNPDDRYIPGTLTYRLIGWTDHLSYPQNRQFFDAVANFSYSGIGGFASLGGATTDDIMANFSFYAARELHVIDRQRRFFPDEEIWVVEFGDLPFYIFESAANYFPFDEDIRGQWQYMKSVGNAIGYVQRHMEMLRHGVATMALYYTLNHTIGFGVIQADHSRPNQEGEGYFEFMAMPSFYAFSEMGSIFNEHTHFFPLTPPQGSNESRNVWLGTDGWVNIDYYRLSGLAFGDEEGAKQAVFVNTSAAPAIISLPDYYFRKTWSLGDGSNPLPDFAVNPTLRHTALPTHVPTPMLHSGGGLSNALFIPAYSMVVADITKPRNLTNATTNGIAESITTTQLTLTFNDDVTSTIRPANISITGGGSNVIVDSVIETGSTRIVNIFGTWNDAANVTVSITGTVSGYTITETQNVVLHRNVTVVSYPVTVAPSVATYVNVSPTTAEAGQTIAVTITPPAGQRLAANGVTATGVTAFTGNTVGSTSVTFVKTAGATEVNAIFENIPLETFTVTFNLNGGNIDGNMSHVVMSDIVNGASVTPPTPTRQNYTLAGWTSNVPGMTLGNITGNVTFTAQWVAVDNNQGGNNNDQNGNNNNQNGNNNDQSGNNQSNDNSNQGNNSSDSQDHHVHAQSPNIATQSQNVVEYAGTETTLPVDIAIPITRDPITPFAPALTQRYPQPTDIPLPFVDVSPTSWYYPFVRAVWEQQLFTGISLDTFNPQGHMTRAMFVQVLANLEGVALNTYRTGFSTFGDVDISSWYFGAIEWAVQQELINGVGDGNFAPNRPITREEMAVLLNRYIVNRGITLPQGETTLFTDQDSIAAWAQEGVAAIQAAGLITGHPDGNFAPQDTATRAEVATLFARFLEIG